jgi:multidrug resistance efflux pump
MLKFVVPLAAMILIAALGFSLDSGLRNGSAAASHSLPQLEGLEPPVAEASGRVEGLTKEAELRPELPGRVVEIRVREGDIVGAGDVLLVLDSTTQRHDEALCQAELTVAEAELERLINGARSFERHEAAAQHRALLSQWEAASKRLERSTALHANHHTTQQQVEDYAAEAAALKHRAEAARAQLELLEAPAREDEVRRCQAKIAAARARLDQARAQREKMTLRAPTSGTVLRSLAQLGELIGPSTTEPAMVFVDTSHLYVRAFVEEFDAPRIELGMAASVTADGLPGRAFAGRVVRLAPSMTRKQIFADDPAENYDTKVREVWIELGSTAPLIIGLRVDVTFRQHSASPASG